MICDHRSLVLLVMVTPADAQDSLVARELLFRLALLHPEIAIVWADSAYAKTGWWSGRRSTSTSHQDGAPPAGGQGLRRAPAQVGLGRGWSWIMRARRHCRDHGRLPEMSESLITWAAITLMTRRLTRRKARPAERRDVVHGYVIQEAA